MSDAINRTILAPSTIRLLGWVLSGVDHAPDETESTERGAIPQEGSLPSARAQRDQLGGYAGESLLLKTLTDRDRVLAYIMAYTYAGALVPLRVPTLFLVRGPGETVVDENTKIDPGRIGLAHLDTTVEFAKGLMFWTYDLSDQTVRLDVSSGTLQQLVINAETGGAHGRGRIDLVGQNGSFSGRLGVAGH
jgi:hypothetical protein